MQPSDLSANVNATVVIAEAMRKAGFKVQLDTLDWGTVSQRRNNKGPVDKGGWNLFITVATALDASTPLTNPYLATPRPNEVAGFPCDEELQRLRRSWWESTDEAERTRLADQIQMRAYQVVPYINGGQWKQYTAVRTNISGLGETTMPVFWDVAKEGDDLADVESIALTGLVIGGEARRQPARWCLDAIADGGGAGRLLFLESLLEAGGADEARRLRQREATRPSTSARHRRPRPGQGWPTPSSRKQRSGCQAPATRP
jgi:hypothetical protein